MEFRSAMAALGLEEYEAALRPGWEDSLQSLPQGEIEFLTELFIRRACERFVTCPEGIEAAVSTARRIEGDAALRALAWHCHRVVYCRAPADRERIVNWPIPERTLGPDARLLCTLVLLSGVPRMEAEHRAHQIPEEIVRATLASIRLGLRRRSDDRPWGMSAHDIGWFSNFLRGELYRLGRLQFQFSKFGRHLHAFRHTATGAVLALSEAGIQYGPDGQWSRGGSGAWTATLKVSESEVTGYPILPEGYAVSRPVTLPGAEWRQVLAPGDGILNIHIPGGDPLAFDRCGESLCQALAFYPRHYPEFDFRGFCCESWILNAWFQRVLPPTSNMRRFQQEVYLFPVEVEVEEIIHTAFGHHPPEDWSQAPRDTSLRRAVAEALAAGRQIEVSGGGCFLLREDLHWGDQVYRKQRLPVAVGEP